MRPPVRLPVTLGALALVLTAHTAQAALPDAALYFEGTAHFPEATLDGRPLALFQNGTRDLLALDLHADALTVHHSRIDYACFGASPLNLMAATTTHRATYPLTDVTLRLVAPATRSEWQGWLGVYPQHATRLNATMPTLQLHPRPHGAVGNNPTPETEPDPQRHFYALLLDAPHLNATAAGTFTLTGPGALKLDGPTVELRAAENTTTFATGEQNPTPGLCSIRREWVHLAYDAAAVTISTAAPLHLALDTSALAWNGTARVDLATGTLDGAPQPAATTSFLDGAYAGTLTPLSGGTHAIAFLRAESLMRPSPAPAPRWFPSAPVGGLPLAESALIALLAILGSGLATHLIAQRITAPSFRRFATSYTKPGEAAFWYADLLHNSFHLDRRAARYIARALRENPSLAGPVELHAPFKDLLARPQVRRALERAWHHEGDSTA